VLVYIVLYPSFPVFSVYLDLHVQRVNDDRLPTDPYYNLELPLLPPLPACHPTPTGTCRYNPWVSKDLLSLAMHASA